MCKNVFRPRVLDKFGSRGLHTHAKAIQLMCIAELARRCAVLCKRLQTHAFRVNTVLGTALLISRSWVHERRPSFFQVVCVSKDIFLGWAFVFLPCSTFETRP